MSQVQPLLGSSREPTQTSCLEDHKGKLITFLACAAIALLLIGGLLFHYSVLSHVVCYSLMGGGGVVGLGAIVTALILYQVCATVKTLDETVTPQGPEETLKTDNPPPEVPPTGGVQIQQTVTVPPPSVPEQTALLPTPIPVISTPVETKPPQQSPTKKEVLPEVPPVISKPHKQTETILSPRSVTQLEVPQTPPVEAKPLPTQAEIQSWDQNQYNQFAQSIDSKCSQNVLEWMCSDEKFAKSSKMIRYVSLKCGFGDHADYPLLILNLYQKQNNTDPLATILLKSSQTNNKAIVQYLMGSSTEPKIPSELYEACIQEACIQYCQEQTSNIIRFSHSSQLQAICAHSSFVKSTSAMAFVYEIFLKEKPENELKLNTLLESLLSADYFNSESVVAIICKRQDFDFAQFYHYLNGKPENDRAIRRLLTHVDQVIFDTLFDKVDEPKFLRLALRDKKFATSRKGQDWICQHFKLENQRDYPSFITHLVSQIWKGEIQDQNNLLQSIFEEYCDVLGDRCGIVKDDVSNAVLRSFTLAIRNNPCDRLFIVLGPIARSMLGDYLAHHFDKTHKFKTRFFESKQNHWEPTTDYEKDLLTWILKPENQALQKEKPILTLLRSLKCSFLIELMAGLEDSHYDELIKDLAEDSRYPDTLLVTLLEQGREPSNSLLVGIKSLDAMNAYYAWFLKQDKQQVFSSLPSAFKTNFSIHISKMYTQNEAFPWTPHAEQDEILQLIANDSTELVLACLNSWPKMSTECLQQYLSNGETLKAALTAMQKAENEFNATSLSFKQVSMQLLFDLGLGDVSKLPPWLNHYAFFTSQGLLLTQSQTPENFWGQSYLDLIQRMLGLVTLTVKQPGGVWSCLQDGDKHIEKINVILQSVRALVDTVPGLKEKVVQECSDQRNALHTLRKTITKQYATGNHPTFAAFKLAYKKFTELFPKVPKSKTTHKSKSDRSSKKSKGKAP